MNRNSVFQVSIRVYYEDTDAGGVVYHAQYLNFFERARTEWLRDLGYDQTTLKHQQQMIFVVRQVHIDYHQPARLDDELVATATIDEVRGASLHFYQTLMRDEDQLASAKIQVACLDYPGFNPKRIPNSMKEELTSVYQC